MKLLFSEHQSDYGHYIFPYAVWGIPEAGETPGDAFNLGFLPGSAQLDRFYLCRQIRVNLKLFSLSSENRRVLRKGDGIRCSLVPLHEFDYSESARRFYIAYADVKFGKEVMTGERLDALFGGRVITHVLVFTDDQNKREVGNVLLYLEDKRIAFYYYAFYDLSSVRQSLGLYMMTSALELFAAEGFGYLYLGTCYSEKALYKTQFSGVQFFNGFRWSENLEELKYLLRREPQAQRGQHLLETPDFQRTYYHDNLETIIAASQFQIKPTPNDARTT